MAHLYRFIMGSALTAVEACVRAKRLARTNHLYRFFFRFYHRLESLNRVRPRTARGGPLCPPPSPPPPLPRHALGRVTLVINSIVWPYVFLLGSPAIVRVAPVPVFPWRPLVLLSKPRFRRKKGGVSTCALLLRGGPPPVFSRACQFTLTLLW